MRDLISKAEFSRRIGSSGAAITKACENVLKAAFDGRYVDANHPDAIAYAKKIAALHAPPSAPGLDNRYEEALEACRDADRWTAGFLRKALGVGSSRATKLAEQVNAAKNSVKVPHVRGTAAAKTKREAEAYRVWEEPEELEPPDEMRKYLKMPLQEIALRYGNAVQFKDYVSAVKDIGAIEERAIKTAKMRGELVSRELVRMQIVSPFDAAHLKMLRDGSQTIATRMASMVGSGATLNELALEVEKIISSFIKPVKDRVQKAMSAYDTQGDFDDD